MSSTLPPLKEAIFGGLDVELANTRKVLLRLPDAQMGWKPHEKSFSVGALAGHMVNIVWWQSTILQQDEFDLATSPPPKTEETVTCESLVDQFDRNAAQVRAVIERLPEDRLETPWTLRHGERVIFTRPRRDVWRSMGLNHLIHHRGQLTVYLRILNEPVPATYGPSADE